MSIMNINAAIIIGGLLSLALAIFHCFFYSHFKWGDEFQNISVLNARIFMTLHIGLIAVFLFFAFLSFVYTKELRGSLRTQSKSIADGREARTE